MENRLAAIIYDIQIYLYWVLKSFPITRTEEYYRAAIKKAKESAEENEKHWQEWGTTRSGMEIGTTPDVFALLLDRIPAKHLCELSQVRDRIDSFLSLPSGWMSELYLVARITYEESLLPQYIVDAMPKEPERSLSMYCDNFFKWKDIVREVCKKGQFPTEEQKNEYLDSFRDIAPEKYIPRWVKELFITYEQWSPPHSDNIQVLEGFREDHTDHSDEIWFNPETYLTT